MLCCAAAWKVAATLNLECEQHLTLNTKLNKHLYFAPPADWIGLDVVMRNRAAMGPTAVRYLLS
jgi:hypothetical protein